MYSIKTEEGREYPFKSIHHFQKENGQYFIVMTDRTRVRISSWAAFENYKEEFEKYTNGLLGERPNCSPQLVSQFYIAIENEDLETINTLLNKGIDIDGKDQIKTDKNDKGWSPLEFALVNDKFRSAQLLLKRGAHYDRFDLLYVTFSYSNTNTKIALMDYFGTKNVMKMLQLQSIPKTDKFEEKVSLIFRNIPAAKMTSELLEGIIEYHPHLIKYIKFPSNNLKRLAVVTDGEVIQYISDPSEELQLQAVRWPTYRYEKWLQTIINDIKNKKHQGDYTRVMGYYKPLSEQGVERIKWIYSKKDIEDAIIIESAIQYIKNPTKKVQQKSAEAIKDAKEYHLNKILKEVGFDFQKNQLVSFKEVPAKEAYKVYFAEAEETIAPRKVKRGKIQNQLALFKNYYCSLIQMLYDLMNIILIPFGSLYFFIGIFDLINNNKGNSTVGFICFILLAFYSATMILYAIKYILFGDADGYIPKKLNKLQLEISGLREKMDDMLIFRWLGILWHWFLSPFALSVICKSLGLFQNNGYATLYYIIYLISLIVIGFTRGLD